VGIVVRFVFLHELGLDADLGFWETEGLAPCISLKHDLYECLEEEADFPLELTVCPAGTAASIPDPAPEYDRLVLPEGWNARAELDR